MIHFGIRASLKSLVDSAFKLEKRQVGLLILQSFVGSHWSEALGWYTMAQFHCRKI